MTKIWKRLVKIFTGETPEERKFRRRLERAWRTGRMDLDVALGVDGKTVVSENGEPILRIAGFTRKEN